MANCKTYQSLSTVEKLELIAKVIHAIQSDENCLLVARSMVRGAEGKGIFQGVTIFPESFTQPINQLEHETSY